MHNARGEIGLPPSVQSRIDEPLLSLVALWSDQFKLRLLGGFGQLRNKFCCNFFCPLCDQTVHNWRENTPLKIVLQSRSIPAVFPLPHTSTNSMGSLKKQQLEEKPPASLPSHGRRLFCLVRWVLVTVLAPSSSGRQHQPWKNTYMYVRSYNLPRTYINHIRTPVLNAIFSRKRRASTTRRWRRRSSTSPRSPSAPSTARSHSLQQIKSGCP